MYLHTSFLSKVVLNVPVIAVIKSRVIQNLSHICIYTSVRMSVVQQMMRRMLISPISVLIQLFLNAGIFSGRPRLRTVGCGAFN